MWRRGATAALILALGVCWLAAPAAAQDDVGRDGSATVFPVVPGGDGRETGGSDRFVAVAGDPERAAAVVTAAGAHDLLRYRGHAFTSHAFGTRHVYLDAAWRPDGRWYLTGYAARERRSSVWLADPSRLQRVHASNVTLRAVDVGPQGTVLVAGGRVAPVRGELVVLSPSAGAYRVPLPRPVPLRDVAWAPDGDGAVAVGVEGTIYRYRDGAVGPVPGADRAFLTGVTWLDDGRFAVVGAETANGTEPAGDGVVYIGNASGVRRAATLTVVPHDVSWRPRGGHGLAVGGREGNATLYRIRPDGSVAARPLDARLPRAVDWYTRDDALIAGGAGLWRYSLRTTADELPATASLSVSPRSPSRGDAIRLDAFGSTSRGSTAAVDAWQFVLGGNVTGWQQRPVATGSVHRAGRFRAGVRVRADDGAVSPWNNTTIAVGDGGTADRPGRSVPAWLLMGLTGAALVVLLAVTWLRDRE